MQDLAGAVALIDDQHRISRAGLDDVDCDVVVVGLIPLQIELIDQQQLTTIEMRNLDGRYDVADDFANVHAGYPLAVQAAVGPRRRIAGSSSTSSMIPVIARSAGTKTTGRACAASRLPTTKTSSPGPAWAVASAAICGSPFGWRCSSSN